jgi:phosphatidylserine decarboxylase
MEGTEPLIYIIPLFAFLIPLLYLFWRYVWFFRNPVRRVPEGEAIVSPADGTVVYVKRVPSNEPVISIKNRRTLAISDIVREDLKEVKLLVGIFMSPFDVHYNRAPLSGEIEFIRRHPAQWKNFHMGSMHWRSLMRRFPIYENSHHLISNERTVTKIRGTYLREDVSCYVVQIAGGSVRGIDSYMPVRGRVTKGHIFGMIRVGSQVDLVITWKEAMVVKVNPGDKVRAGETIVIE